MLIKCLSFQKVSILLKLKVVCVFVIVLVFLWVSTCPFITLIKCLEGLKTIILFFLYVN